MGDTQKRGRPEMAGSAQARVAVVTGAAGSLGAGVASTLGEAGYAVVGIALNETFAKPASFAMTMTGIDLTSAEETGEAFATIGGKFDSIVTLINVAGGFAWETGERGSIETWDRLFSWNLRTTFNATTAALPLLLKCGGSIVNVAAAAALRADLGMGAYAASKSAVLRLTESFAIEFKDRGIRVNAVLPSVLDTAANRAAMPDADVSRWVSIEALASVIAFLASDAARAVTGALLPVMGRL